MFYAFLFFSLQVSEAIIKDITGSNAIFGGDLSIVVHLLKPTLGKYNRDKEEVFELTGNMFYISNTLVASYQTWTELTDVHQRFLLSTTILRNIDNTGFLFLSENLFSNFTQTTTFNITMRFSFQYLDVVLDTIGSGRKFPHCYDFDQVMHKLFENSSHFLKGIHLYSCAFKRWLRAWCGDIIDVPQRG